MLIRIFRATLIALGLFAAANAAPLRVLAIGDSMTEEYAFELTFSAPPGSSNANTRNWPELLRIFRITEAWLGPYESTAFAYGDLRNAGHEWNFGIPAATTWTWLGILTADSPSDGLDYWTRSHLIDQLYAVEAVVIFIGGNDLKQDYDDIFNDTEPANFFSSLLNRIKAIRTWIRGFRPDVPIVVCTVPDVGATPDISSTFNIPAKQVTTRAKIAAFNQSIIDWAAGVTNAPLEVARIDLLTDRVFDQMPFHLNGTIFTIPGQDQNPPDRVFCRDNFHPSTVAQALIANEIIKALNTATGSSITPFSNREILQNLLGLNPDQPYIDWIAAAGLAGSGMNEDPDYDGFPNIAEQLLGTPPGIFSQPLSGSFSPGQSLSWLPDEIGLRYGNLTPEESGNLEDWSPVPPERVTLAPDGTVSITPAVGTEGFARLRAEAK